MAKDLLVTIDADGPLPGRLRVHGRPAAVELARFEAFAKAQAEVELGERPYERVILVGDGEALERDGVAFATIAREAGFPVRRLDTSPRRLIEPGQVRAVVRGAGISEFSLGIHGPTAEIHDDLVGRPGDFAALERAIRTLSQHEVSLLFDTILTRTTLATLGETLDLMLAAGPARIALWSYAPAHDTAETRAEIPALDELVAALPGAIARCREAGVEVVLRHVPACLLGVHEALLDNTTPDAFDGVRGGRPLPRYNCLHEAKCELSELCGGLAHAYVNAHGWALDQLDPPPRTHEWRPRDRSVETQTGGVAGPRGHGPWLALLGEHAAAVESIGLTRSEARYPLQMADGTRLILVLTKRDSTVRYFRQSRSFNLSYTDVEGPASERAIGRYIDPILTTIQANDDGSLCLS